MFTGIVEKTAPISAVVDSAGFRRLTLGSDWTDVRPGESVAVNGCCLTIAQIDPDGIAFDIVQETLEKTNLGFVKIGDFVNVERSLKLSDRLDGHFVQGHVDGRALLIESKSDAKECRFRLETPTDLGKYLIPKGSVTLDGVSLTLASVQGNIFEVALIPTTLRLTTFGRKRPGWLFNLEADVLSKTIISWLERQGAPAKD